MDKLGTPKSNEWRMPKGYMMTYTDHFIGHNTFEAHYVPFYVEGSKLELVMNPETVRKELKRRDAEIAAKDVRIRELEESNDVNYRCYRTVAKEANDMEKRIKELEAWRQEL